MLIGHDIVYIFYQNRKDKRHFCLPLAVAVYKATYVFHSPVQKSALLQQVRQAAERLHVYIVDFAVRVHAIAD